MDFGFAMALNEDVYERHWRSTHALGKALQAFFADKAYGASLVDITVGIVCQPEDSSFYPFKREPRYSKRDKVLEYHVDLDYTLMLRSDEAEARTVVLFALMASVATIRAVNIPDFDVDAFEKDLREACSTLRA